MSAVVELIKQYINEIGKVFRIVLVTAASSSIAFFTLRLFRKKHKELNVNNFFMKDFLYLDMDFLENFTAQKDKGFISSINHEEESSKSRKLGIFDVISQFISFSAAGTLKKRYIRSMQQREDMFDVFLESKGKDNESLVKKINGQMLENGIFSQTHLDKIEKKLVIKELDKLIEKELEASIGKYVRLETYFDFISLKRLEDLTTSEMQKFYYGKEKSFSIKDEIHRMKMIEENIERLKKLLPFNSFLTAKNAVVLLEEESLREANNQTGFKFNSNNMIVVGKVEREIGVRKNSAPANQMLDKIQMLTRTLLQEIGIIREGYLRPIYLIRPIAIYSEQSVLREKK